MTGAERFEMTAYRPTDQVVVREQGGRAFLLDLTTSRYYELNRTGVLVWNALTQGDDPAAAVRAAFPGVDEERLERDVDSLVGELVSAGLVTSDQS
jgi:hypothetical protein